MRRCDREVDRYAMGGKREIRCVHTSPTIQTIISGAAPKNVVARIARKGIVAIIAVDGVVAITARGIFYHDAMGDGKSARGLGDVPATAWRI